jgi:hypothetical protein
MEMLPKLSEAQSLLLSNAARRADGRVIPHDSLRGGARSKVLTALLQRGWIEHADDSHVMTRRGLRSHSCERRHSQWTPKWSVRRGRISMGVVIADACRRVYYSCRATQPPSATSKKRFIGRQLLVQFLRVSS